MSATTLNKPASWIFFVFCIAASVVAGMLYFVLRAMGRADFAMLVIFLCCIEELARAGGREARRLRDQDWERTRTLRRAAKMPSFSRYRDDVGGF